MNKKLIIICIVAALAAVGLGIGLAVKNSNSGKENTQTTATQQTEEKSSVKSEEKNAETNKSNESNAVVNENNKEANNEVQPEPTEEIKVNPTFMYFVDNAQESETAALIEELKASYPNVNFDIKNVEADPEIINNFELVKGNTPALIMLDTSNNICGFEFMCTDKAKLEAAIKGALGE